MFRMSLVTVYLWTCSAVATSNELACLDSLLLHVDMRTTTVNKGIETAAIQEIPIQLKKSLQVGFNIFLSSTLIFYAITEFLK